MQYKITDSLLLTHAIETEGVNSAYVNPDDASLTNDNNHETKLSPEALHKLLSLMVRSNLSNMERTKNVPYGYYLIQRHIYECHAKPWLGIHFAMDQRK